MNNGAILLGPLADGELSISLFDDPCQRRLAVP